MEGKRDKLLHVILIYVVFSGITYWLPLTRGAFDGASYEWSGWLGAGGKGIGGHYWLLFILTSILIMVVILGWRGIHKPFRWLLLTWFLILIVESGSWFFSENVQIKGDTFGYDFAMPIGKLVFPLDLLFLFLSCFWIIRDIRSKKYVRPTPWNKINRNLFIHFFCLLPVQFILLRFFDHNEIFDQIGVFLTIFQWILLNLSLYPWKVQSP